MWFFNGCRSRLIYLEAKHRQSFFDVFHLNRIYGDGFKRDFACIWIDF